MAEQIETPWYVGTSDGWETRFVYAHGVCIATLSGPVAEANADAICLAVNSFGAMENALITVRAWLASTTDTDPALGEVAELVSSALALAKGGAS